MKNRMTVMILTAAIMLAMAVSIIACGKRVQVENRNNVVEMVADYNDIERMAEQENTLLASILEKLRGSGINSIALTEDLISGTDINMLSGIDPKKLNLYIKSTGLSIYKARLIQSSGLRVVPRIRNSFSLNKREIASKLLDISSYDMVIFAEEEVLGYPNYIREVSTALKENKIKYGFIEFGKQLGDVQLAAYAGVNMARVHSIPVDEMENMSKKEALDRYLRAVKERNIRILYVHMLQYPENGKTLLTTNISFISELKAALTENKFVIGKASMPEDLRLNRDKVIMIGLGVASGAVLLLNYFIPVNMPAAFMLVALFAIILPAKLLALLAAIVFPSYAVISQFPAKRDKLVLGVLSQAVSITVNIAGITALGAVFIAALLSGAAFMLGVDSFVGVKLAFIAPIMIIAAYFFLRTGDGKFKTKTSLVKIRELLNMNISVLHALIFLGACAAASVLILRSGNFGLPVPGFEKAARGLLENILSIRPRTKEFLIGYPAIILACMYYLKGGDKWLWLLLSVAVLAPISLINSFCHIHTPLMISVVRSCTGLILGVAIGLIFYLFYVIGHRVYGIMNK